MLLYIKFTFSLFVYLLTGNVTLDGPHVTKISSVIPADAMSFGAISDGKKVIVNWSTGNERTFDYFTIERSKDGVNFVTAVMIKGGGKISTLVDYTDIDYRPFSGISYYRLKQTDYSGESTFTEAVTVNFQLLKDGTVVPYSEKLPDASELKEIEDKAVLVLVKDAKGQEYISKIHVTADGEHLYATDARNTLNQGTYIIVASSCNRLCSQKLIIK